MTLSTTRRASRWARAIGFASFAAVLFAGLTVAAGPDETVVIRGLLRPAQIEIDPGTSVTWRNRDSERHRVRSKEGPVEFDSGNLERGESFSFTFTVEGTYPYYDHRHRDDTAYFGMIIVGGTDMNLEGPLPEAGGISIIDKSFQPGSIVITTGGTVDWSNDDGEAHTVTSTTSTFDSGIMNGGATFSQTFAESGSHPYFCLIHPEMRGTIEVRDPGAVASAEEPPTDAVEPVAPIGDPDPGSTLAVAPSEQPGATANGVGSTLKVSTIDRSFRPEAIEVIAGDTVTWSNDDTEGHTVTAVDGGFNSGVMTVGDIFSMTLDSAGTFDYFCAIHPEMTGTIMVTEAGAG